MVELTSSSSSGTTDTILVEQEQAKRNREVVSSLYHYSDLSVRNIAQQVGISLKEVQQITVLLHVRFFRIDPLVHHSNRIYVMWVVRWWFFMLFYSG
ncbi:MAG: hypothetical protein WAM14_05100 [Candidatus Nitrosopolaris sp.]